ncbi:MAG: DUF4118 domain-containing protein [Roseburia sp.]|nr:DUF4118 domain-containing protein [Roseburia sp.]
MTAIVKKQGKNFLNMVWILALATGIGYGFLEFHMQETNIVLVYVLAVLFIAWRTNSFLWGITASFLGTTVFNFFFTQPVHTLFVYDSDYFLTFLCMIGAAVFSAALTLQTKKYLAQVYQERKQVEQEQYRANLLRSISHDLRTPLMGIMGTSEMIMDMSEQQDPRRALAKDIYQDADWLHELVENILGLTRLQDGKVNVNQNIEPLEEILGTAVLHIEKSHPEYEINIQLPEEYIEIIGDGRLLSQVFINLLDNAVKHTPPKGEIKVAVRLKQENQVEILVLDPGKGIAEKDLPYIFDLFYTSAEKEADAKHGIGLGLAVSKLIVEAHNGTITAENRKDRTGAAFRVCLPVYHGDIRADSVKVSGMQNMGSVLRGNV